MICYNNAIMQTRKTSKKTSNKGSKKGKIFMRRGGNNKKKSLKKTQIVGGGRKHKNPVATPAEVAPPTREQLLERRLALIESLQKLRAELEARGEDDFISMRMRYIQKEIYEIDFQLKTPGEQEAILARRSAASVASVAFKERRKESDEQREQEETARKLEQQLEQKRLDREKMQAVRSEEQRRVEEWEQAHLSQLQDKSFVRSQLHGLQTHHETLTAEGQPRGATLGYPIWYGLMVELLHKYERA
jgi:hypothetical protein